MLMKNCLSFAGYGQRTDGDVIPGGGGMRKVRCSRAGMGRRSGARVIYFNRLERGEVVLYLAYAKAKFDNMRPEFLIKLKEQYDG